MNVINTFTLWLKPIIIHPLHIRPGQNRNTPIMYYLQHERPCFIGYTNSSRRRELYVSDTTLIDANVQYMVHCETLRFYGPIDEVILKIHLI